MQSKQIWKFLQTGKNTIFYLQILFLEVCSAFAQDSIPKIDLNSTPFFHLDELQLVDHFVTDSYDVSGPQKAINLARQAAKESKNKEAVELFQRAIQINPQKRRELLQEYADQLSYAGRANEAIPIYREILASSPTQEETYLVHKSLSKAYTWVDQFQNAVIEYDYIIAEECKKNRENALITLARYAASKQKNQEALDLFGQAMNSNYSNKDLLREYADQLSYLGRANEAIPFYKQILASNPSLDESLLVHKNLAQAYTWVGQFQNALIEHDYIISEQCKKKKAEALIDLARYAASKQQNQDALNLFQQAIEIYPAKRQELLLELADQLSFTGHADQAVPLYEEIMTLNRSTEEIKKSQEGLARAYKWIGPKKTPQEENQQNIELLKKKP
ncbi:MAG: hypothetical protein H0U49_04665 [Parachlamydiaceae bacterium]|nr:hypothetical protein [Parachlamydiaceae bacterium]